MITLDQSFALYPCADLLRDRSGGVILAPTETVYGLLCADEDQQAREKIYRLKHRPASKQLALFLPSVEYAVRYVPPLHGVAKVIAQTFMPGAVTLVVPDGKGSTFGFRIPDHPFILKLLKEYQGAIASTSANLSGTPSALNITDALSSLDGVPEIAVDGGMIPADSLASTVIFVNADDTWKIIRPGPVTREMLLNALK